MLLDNCVPAELLAETWSPPSGGPPTLLFVGNLAYLPNAAAVRLIVSDILPRVRRRLPEARLVVCGARGEALAREHAATPGVEWRGFVDDLRPLYRNAHAMLVPVPLAGGTQYKLLESMAVGLPGRGVARVGRGDRRARRRARAGRRDRRGVRRGGRTPAGRSARWRGVCRRRRGPSSTPGTPGPASGR